MLRKRIREDQTRKKAPLFTMAPCTGICQNGRPCAFKAKTGLTVCGRHLVNQDPNVQRCGMELSNGRLCGKACADGGEICRFHVRILERRQRQLRMRRSWVRVLEILWGDRDVEAAEAELWAAFARNDMTEQNYRVYQRVLFEEVAFFHELNAERVEVVPRGEMEALALDRQNVHTTAVSQQTRTGMDILLETPVSSDQNTLREIERVWEESRTRSIRMVLTDMRQWYNVQTCRTEDDWLYRRTLDGLWSYIKQSCAKEELVERLWEECYESVRMCCDGHLSRLCNVLCGFQEEFKPQVSVGELLQQRISAIAEREIPVEDKVGEAWIVFEELAIPMEQREAWVDAF